MPLLEFPSLLGIWRGRKPVFYNIMTARFPPSRRQHGRAMASVPRLSRQAVTNTVPFILLAADRPRRAKAGRNQPKVQRLPSVSSDDESSDENSVTRCICHKIRKCHPFNDMTCFCICQFTPSCLCLVTTHLKLTFPSPFPLDNDGMMVQCDNCNVWQHCPCVGLAGITEDEMPDQYYCEECKPENHVVADTYGR